MVITLPFDPTPLAAALLTVWLVAITWTDIRSYRIPDALSLSLIGLGMMWSATAFGPGLWSAAIGAGVGYGALALIGEVYFRRTGTEGLGLGDAKLFGASGAWLGWQALPTVLLCAAVAGLVFALIRRRSADRRIAFGPWLALAFWGVWIGPAVLAYPG